MTRFKAKLTVNECDCGTSVCNLV